MNKRDRDGINIMNCMLNVAREYYKTVVVGNEFFSLGLPEPSRGRSPKEPIRLKKERERSLERFNLILGWQIDELQTSAKSINAWAEAHSLDTDTEPMPEELRCDLYSIPLRMGRLCNTISQDHLEQFYLFPHNPVGIIPTGDGPTETMKPNQIYLNVTHATRDQVDDIWPLIKVYQDTLDEQGLTDKRRAGRSVGPIDPEIKRWIARAEEVGEKEALAEYRAGYGQLTGEWSWAYHWWYQNVRSRLGADVVDITRNYDP